MNGSNAMRRLCLVLLAASVGQAYAGHDSGAIRLSKPKSVTRHVAAFPRLAVGAEPASIARINNALTQADGRVRKAARDCQQADRKHANWTRKISVPMQGPRYLSLIATDDYFCGGAHPDNSTVALVFDLDTGLLADWAKLLPDLAQHTGTDTAGDGSTLGTIASQKLADLYKDAAKHSGSDPACADALKDTELNFILWPDAKQDGLTVQPAGLPHVIASCGPATTIPVKTLKTLDGNAELLDAIEAAHQGH
jgi:hypothetical protein